MKAAKKPVKIKKKVTQDLKTKFRRSKPWKDLRLKVRKEQRVDPVTLKPLSVTFNLHHLDLNPDNYTEIGHTDHFVGLNSQTHDVVHFFFGDGRIRKDWRSMVERLVAILERMEELNN